MAAVWSFVTLEQPQYAGNTRYDDSEDRYSFDSFVANSRHYATEIRPCFVTQPAPSRSSVRRAAL